MKCPKCGRTQRFTKKEKSIALEKSVAEIPCFDCGTILTVHDYDVDVNLKRKHNAKIGICSNCGCRPVTEGYKTCDHCRNYQADRKKYIPSVQWKDLFMKPEKPKQPDISLDDVAVIARQKGISYGDMVAIMEGRKKEKKDLD